MCLPSLLVLLLLTGRFVFCPRFPPPDLGWASSGLACSGLGVACFLCEKERVENAKMKGDSLRDLISSILNQARSRWTPGQDNQEWGWDPRDPFLKERATRERQHHLTTVLPWPLRRKEAKEASKKGVDSGWLSSKKLMLVEMAKVAWWILPGNLGLYTSKYGFKGGTR